MKINFNHSILALAAACALVACEKTEVFDSSVTRELSMTLDGKDWNIYYGTSNRPLFIYNANGEYVGNYSTSYRFALDNGTYKVLATNQADYLTPPTNLNDQVIEQDPETRKTFAISDAVDYNAGDPMKLALKTRTGLLRLRSLDEKADKSYSIVRAVVTTPVHAYKVSDASIVTGEPIELVRHKETAGGGIGYTEEALLIGSDANLVKLRIDYLDADSNVVNTKEFADGVYVLPNDTTEVAFQLNNPDEKVIMNYTVSLASEQWGQSTLYPSVKVEVPEGYTYVEPGQDLNAAFNAQKNDDEVDVIRLFLAANTNYQFSTNTLSNLNKGLSIIAQKPGYGQTSATLTLGAVSMTGDISEIHFENIAFRPGDRFFNLRNVKFTVDRIEFINCSFADWGGVIWYQMTNADRQQVVNNVVMRNCRFTNYTAGRSAIWGPSTSKIAPIYNWEFTNCLFHGRNFGTNTVVLTNLNKVDGDITVKIHGCTFIDTRGTDFTYFNLDGKGASSLKLSVKDNVVAGSTSGVGTWFKLGKVTSTEQSGNTRAKGYQMKAYGIDTPAESALDYNQILSNNKL